MAQKKDEKFWVCYSISRKESKYTYGILENTSNMFKKASAKSGITGVVPLQLCEQRLDNVVFRLGFTLKRGNN